MWMRLLVVSLAVGCGSTSPAPPTAPLANVATTATAEPSPAGVFKQKHTVPVVCQSNADGWCDEEVEDSLTIKDATGGAIAVSIELVQTNAHLCSFENELRPGPAPARGTRRWTFDQADEVGPCSLTLDRTATEVTIKSEGCRSYCGARASLDASFGVP